MMIWKPDSCYCIVLEDENANPIEILRACKLHEGLSPDLVLAHNQSLNIQPLKDAEAILSEKAAVKELTKNGK